MKQFRVSTRHRSSGYVGVLSSEHISVEWHCSLYEAVCFMTTHDGITDRIIEEI